MGSEWRCALTIIDALRVGRLEWDEQSAASASISPEFSVSQIKARFLSFCDTFSGVLSQLKRMDKEGRRGADVRAALEEAKVVEEQLAGLMMRLEGVPKVR